MNKYLGHESGLIGPVPKKPSISENRFWVKGEYSTKPDFELLKAANELYAEDLEALTPIPCEGWKPEVGREYTEGVDIKLTNEYECTLLHLATHFHEIMFGGWAFSNPKAEYWYHKNTRRYYWEIGDVRQDGTYPCYGRKDDIIDQDEIVVVKYLFPVAVPLPDAQPSPELDHPEEKPINWKEQIADWFNKMSYASNVPVDTIIDYIDRIILQPAPAAPQEGEKTYDPFVQKHLSRIKLGLASVGATSVFIPCMPQDEGAFNLPNTNTWLREIKFDSIEASPTYPAEFVEWLGGAYIRLHGVWCHKFADTFNKDNFKTTAQLFTEWKRIKDQ